MGKTILSIEGDNFLINGKLTYSEYNPNGGNACGLLMNQRLIQGIFDDPQQRNLYWRGDIGYLEPEKNTDDLIRALPQWYRHGMRAFTIGFQGGWPVGMVDAKDIHDNPFGRDGLSIQEDYKNRLLRVLKAADDLGMAVIVSLFYWAQVDQMNGEEAVRNAVRTACRFLKETGYRNIIIEVVNEFNIPAFSGHPCIFKAERLAELHEIARKESGGMIVTSSGAGGTCNQTLFDASDVVFVHGNGLSRGRYSDLLLRAKGMAKGKPILCNEDSANFTRLEISAENHISWGYYNNDKQLPPCHWEIERGEDEFFAWRMAKSVGLDLPEPEEKYVLQGASRAESFGDHLNVIRLASLYPEKIDYVEFYKNGKWIYKSYDEPFFAIKWQGEPIRISENDRYMAVVTLCDGRKIEVY